MVVKEKYLLWARSTQSNPLQKACQVALFRQGGK